MKYFFYLNKNTSGVRIADEMNNSKKNEIIDV